jgi:xanthine dehydrogenase small subunit
MRDYILLYINGQRHEIRGEQAFMSLSDYLRYERSLTGTKVVCAEGDCGACTILKGTLATGASELAYQAINSCIAFVNLLDCSHIVTVEGLKDNGVLNPVQNAMVQHHGAQCGFCTPGFVCTLTDLCNEHVHQRPKGQQHLEEKQLRNALTGNLCRCTGYAPIIEAGLSIDLQTFEPLQKRYNNSAMYEDLRKHLTLSVRVESQGKLYYAPTQLADALAFKAAHAHAKLFSSATDMGVLINKDRANPTTITSLNLVPEAHLLAEEAGMISVGARISLTELERFTRHRIPEFSRLLRIFASPQIKNKGTLVGNVANASPIADTLPFLFVANAEIELANQQGRRRININQLYTGYKQLDMRSDELITRILIPVPSEEDIIKLYKVSNRKDLDISTFTAGFRLRLNQGQISEIAIAYGGVGPTVMRMPQTEAFLTGQPFTRETLAAAGAVARSEIKPISDVRASADYRLQVAENILIKLWHEVSEGALAPA